MSGARRDDGAWLQRDPTVRLRRERDGGVAFHRGTGDLLDLDGEGFAVLRALAAPSSLRALRDALAAEGVRVRVPELAGFVGGFASRGFVRSVDRAAAALPGDPWADADARGPDLRAPLVVHWALTYRCNLQCAFCYAESGPWRDAGPTPAVRQAIVAALARWGVLEVALGGGEPTTVPDLPAVLAAIRAAGMVPNVTTNGVALSDAVVEALAAHAGVVHVSADDPEALDAARGAGVAARVAATVRRLRGAGVRVGINLLLTPGHAQDLRPALDAAVALGATGVTLLRPKGEWAASRWPGFPTTRDIAKLARSLRAFMRGRPPISLAVDTALRTEWARAGLFDDPEPGVLGCGGAQRHVALTPEGDVYPCSHARHATYRMGNLLGGDGDALWRRGLARDCYLADCDGTRCPCRRGGAARAADAPERGRRRLRLRTS